MQSNFKEAQFEFDMNLQKGMEMIYPFTPHNSACTVIRIFKDLKLRKGEKSDPLNSAPILRNLSINKKSYTNLFCSPKIVMIFTLFLTNMNISYI